MAAAMPLGILFILRGLLLITCAGSPARAETDGSQTVFGARPGYLFNVNEEKNRHDVEMVMLEEPQKTEKPLKDVIFDEKLSKEFQQQYKYRFGETQAEQITNNPGRDDEYTYYNTQSVTIQAYQQYQSQFAQYMLRRLVEYHFDNWAKKDRDFRPVYEMKDKISNVDVQVKKGYKLKIKYNLSGPNFETAIENPYNIEAKIQYMMSGIISKPTDVIYTIGKQVTPRVKVQTIFRQTEQLIQLVATRKMTKHISMSLTGSTGQLPGNPTIRQDLALLGFSWTE